MKQCYFFSSNNEGLFSLYSAKSRTRIKLEWLKHSPYLYPSEIKFYPTYASSQFKNYILQGRQRNYSFRSQNWLVAHVIPAGHRGAPDVILACICMRQSSTVSTATSVGIRLAGRFVCTVELNTCILHYLLYSKCTGWLIFNTRFLFTNKFNCRCLKF